MKRLVSMFFAATLLLWGSSSTAEVAQASAPADSQKERAKEIQDLKSRIEALEKKTQETEVVDELGHKLHPIHSIYGLKISGGVTLTAQGVNHMKGRNQRGQAAVSADLTLESPVGNDGRAVGVLDFQRGSGLQNIPPLFTSPNGNPTGPNNDIESFNNDQIHVAQFYYEHNFSKKVILSIGQLDPTAYFDANDFANNERFHFLANQFANNPAVEFGGSENFYTPGVRLTYFPVENFDVSLGAFEGNGDYADAFDNPFLMAEANLKLKPMGRDGNYRIYYWNRQGRPSSTLANLANPNDRALLKAENKGVGISIDQRLTDSLGVWLRAGEQRKKVSQFDRYIGGGINLGVAFAGRPNDNLGLGYGLTLIGKDYKAFKKSAGAFKDGPEHYLELYYNLAVGEATQFTGFHISPDLQYVMNPGGDSNASKLFIYGIRLQTFF